MPRHNGNAAQNGNTTESMTIQGFQVHKRFYQHAMPAQEQCNIKGLSRKLTDVRRQLGEKKTGKIPVNGNGEVFYVQDNVLVTIT